MEKQTLSDTDRFMVSVMERLNAGADLLGPVPGLLRDTCDFFDFGCGFIYEAGYDGLFSLREHYILYQPTHLPEPADFAGTAGGGGEQDLAGRRVLFYTDGQPADDTERLFAGLFGAKSLVLVPVRGENSRVAALVGMADRRQNSRKLERSLELVYSVLSALANHVKLQLYRDQAARTRGTMEHIINNMGVDVLVSDLYTYEVLFANSSVAGPHGGAESLLGKPCWQAQGPAHTGPCAGCPQPAMAKKPVPEADGIHSWEFQQPDDGSWYQALSSVFRWVDGRPAHVVNCIDITASKRNEELVRRSADHDALTGLYNRRRLMADMDDHLTVMRQTGEEGFVLFFDLDGFKTINDSLGHAAGDEVLRQIGQSLRSCTLTSGVSYRNGGDEFVVLVRGTLNRAMETISWLQMLFDTSWSFGDKSTRCGCSIGVSHFPPDGSSAPPLLHNADRAMYAGKRRGGGKALFYAGGAFLTAGDYHRSHSRPAAATSVPS